MISALTTRYENCDVMETFLPLCDETRSVDTMAAPINSRALNDLQGNSEPPPPSVDGDPIVGTVVAERYRVVRKLGEGTQASVYVAKHTLIKRFVALKILSAAMAADRELVRRFLDEGQVAGTMGHPNIVESLDMGATDDGRPFLVLEYLDGMTVAEELHAKNRLEVGRAAFIGMQIASALSEAHSRGIVHRDLKPENVFLVDRDGHGDHVKVLDFGISKLESRNEGARAGLVYGTPDYMAPEQVTAPATVDARVDVFALGAMLYEMLSGRAPLDAKDSEDALEAVIRRAPVSLSRINPHLPAGLIQIVEKAMHKDRNKRTQTIAEVRDALEPFSTVSSPRSSPPVSQSRLSGVQLSGPPSERTSIPAVLPPPMISSPSLLGSGPATAVTVVDAPPRRMPVAVFAGVGGALVAGLAVFFAVKSTTQSHALSAVAVNKLDTNFNGAPANPANPTADPTVGNPGVSNGNGNYHAPPSTVAGRPGSKYTWPPSSKSSKPGAPAAAEEPSGFVAVAAAPEPVVAAAAAPEPVAAREAAASPTPPPAVAAPAAPVANGKPVPFGEGMTRPSPISASEFRYPREAIESKTSGVMIVRCNIAPDGSTSACRILKSVPFMDAPVLEALTHHRGTPVTKDGKALAVEYTFTIKFAAQ